MASPFELLPQGVPLAELVALLKEPAVLERRVGGAALVLTPAGMQQPRILEKTRTHDLLPNDARGAAFFIVPLKKRDGSDGKLFLIGRAATNDVVINDVTLSKLHAFLRQGPSGDYLLEDGGSKNGTFCEDTPVPARGDGAPVKLATPSA